MRFGVFVPQGWRMDLVGIGDPVAQYEAMTAVARAADAEPAIDSIWVSEGVYEALSVARRRSMVVPKAAQISASLVSTSAS